MGADNWQCPYNCIKSFLVSTKGQGQISFPDVCLPRVSLLEGGGSRDRLLSLDLCYFKLYQTQSVKSGQ